MNKFFLVGKLMSNHDNFFILYLLEQHNNYIKIEDIISDPNDPLKLVLIEMKDLGLINIINNWCIITDIGILVVELYQKLGI